MADLDVLLADGVIDEVLGRLKSGKEADVSLVRRGDQVIAAKVYKDRATRSFKNNADYKEGRKVRNSRTQRAIDSGGRFGREAAEQAWKSAEADALYRLVGSGVRVPTPVMFYEGVLLMELVCDSEGRPAPRLIDVAIEPSAAMSIYADLLAQMISMLCCDLIHGDLSPYNILAAADGPTIIDFPQVISAAHSSRAEYFFVRDFDNLVRFLSSIDPSLAVHRADGRAIWRAYVSRHLTPEFVPPPPPPPPSARASRGPDRGPRSEPPRPSRGPDRGPRSEPPARAQRPEWGPRPEPPRPSRGPAGPRSEPPARAQRPEWRGERQPDPGQRWDRTAPSRQSPPAVAQRPQERGDRGPRRPTAPPLGASAGPSSRDTQPRRPSSISAAPAPARIGRRRRPKRRW